jgi:hypothetical protein
MSFYFDPTDVPPDDHDGFTPLPAGWYHVEIIGSEAVMSKTPEAGEMLKLQVEINANEHPEHAGRQVWRRLCVNHQTNEQTRNIARRQLSSICHAIGLNPMNSPDELLGAKLVVKLKVTPAKGEYEAGNDITAWKAPEAQQETQPPPKQAQPPRQGARSGGWKA